MGPILFLLYNNDLPLAIPDCNVNIYADDTTSCRWMANSNPFYIQYGLQEVSTKQIYGSHLHKITELINRIKSNSQQTLTVPTVVVFHQFSSLCALNKYFKVNSKDKCWL